MGSKALPAKRNEDHPFGHGRESYFWAFVVAMVLFSLGGLFALYEGVNKLQHPHETDNLAVAVVILLVAIVLESFSLRTAVRESRHFKKLANHGGDLFAMQNNQNYLLSCLKTSLQNLD